MLLLQHCLCVLSCAVALGQTAGFEVASVKPSRAGDRVRGAIRGGPDSGQIAFTNVTLMNVVLRAYNAKPFEVSGPDWLSSERYDIVAKIPPETTKDQVLLMLQRLLAERFHMVVHRESRELRGYELLGGKSGSKLRRSSEDGPDVQPTEEPKRDGGGFPQLTAPGLVIMEGVRGTAVVSFLTARAQPMAAFVEMLSKEFRMPVVDKTGLTGKFDFTLEFAPQAPGAMAVETSNEAAANLISSIPQQLGLKLEPKKIAVDVLVVDAADKVPVEN